MRELNRDRSSTPSSIFSQKNNNSQAGVLNLRGSAK